MGVEVRPLTALAPSPKFLNLRLGHPGEVAPGQFLEDLPGQVQGLGDGAVFIRPLAQEFFFKGPAEIEHLAVPRRQAVFPDDRRQGLDAPGAVIDGVELRRHVAVVFPGVAGADAVAHQPGK